MAYSVVTWTAGAVVTKANMDQVNSNFLYLLNRPATRIVFLKGSTYTIASATFADIDTTNLSITLAMSGTAVLCAFTCSGPSAGLQSACFDLSVDGVRYANTTQGLFSPGGTVNTMTFCWTVLVTGLSAASHTFRPQWMSISGTSTMNSTSATSPVCFSAVEVG